VSSNLLFLLAFYAMKLDVVEDYANGAPSFQAHRSVMGISLGTNEFNPRFQSGASGAENLYSNRWAMFGHLTAGSSLGCRVHMVVHFVFDERVGNSLAGMSTFVASMDRTRP
jgi:hypothetical protein